MNNKSNLSYFLWFFDEELEELLRLGIVGK